MDDFDELRRLLLGKEQDELRELRAQAEDREKRTQDVSGVLPNAIKLSRAKGGDFSRALQPSVEESIRESVKERPGLFIDAVYPVLGPLVRRSISESLSGMVQSFNRALENTFSWQGLMWRWEALRTGRPFREVVLLRSLAYRVEQIFLIHRETSLCLLHVGAKDAAVQEPELISGMLSAIQDFARDALKTDAEATLGDFTMGDHVVWMAPGPRAYLAAVIRGDPRRELRAAFAELIENVHILKGAELANFQGDSAPFESLRAEFEANLVSQQRPGAVRPPSFARVWLALGTAVAVVLGAGFAAWRSSRQWENFQARLRAEPGIVVTSAEKHWIADSRVDGLRDPFAREPAKLAEDAGIKPSRLALTFKSYRAHDPTIVRRRFAGRFGMPAGARLEFADDRLTLSGPVPYEWLERVRRDALLIPGITALVETDAQVTFDPALVLERFVAAYPLPPEARAEFAAGTLSLLGSAPYEWIAPVREGATRLPGITGVNEKGLRVVFDPKLVLQRFEGRFGLPDGATAAVQDGSLVLGGEASHAWIARVRSGATSVSGITSLDERQLTDLDQRALQQSRSVIESAFVYFLPNKDAFATEGFTALSRLPDEIRRCVTAAKRLGVDLSIEVRGHADATGISEKNVELSQRRADAVHRFLISCGFDAALFTPLALGAPSALPDEKPLSEQSQRRVAFRVIAQADSARP